MRRFLPLFLIVVIVMGALPAATGQQEVIPLSSSLYSEMDLLFLITGSGTPSGSRPWTKAEASQMFSRIDRDGLKETGRDLYDSIAGKLETGLRWNLSDGFSLSAYLDLSFELYGHSNTDFSSQGAWEYSFVDRRPLARARLDMALSDYFYTYADLQYGYGPYTYDDTLPRLQESGHTLVGALIPDTSGANNLRYFDCETPLVQYTKQWATNVLPASKHFDFQWPKRAVFSMGTDKLNFSLSRDKISWGNSKIGNFVVDDHVDYHEYARFTTFSRYFKYEALTIFFDTHYAAYDHFQVLLAHRLEFRPWDVLTIAVSENVMYKDKVFQLQYLNPAFILHNLNNHSTLNAIAHAEIDWVPAPSLRLYGQFALDQATAPNEGDNEEVNQHERNLQPEGENRPHGTERHKEEPGRAADSEEHPLVLHGQHTHHKYRLRPVERQRADVDDEVSKLFAHRSPAVQAVTARPRLMSQSRSPQLDESTTLVCLKYRSKCN